MYTLVETCKQNKVDPYHYLADVLERILTHPNSRIKELLPYNWKPAHGQNYNVTTGGLLPV
ncbi:MAG: transposase domain-containing protein [Alphaproteobacteria bacterium]|nr:transposase domain-containing protein [Alphaproteobacteria bacterium]